MPARIAHYELLDRISEGGMGVVYRARDTRLDRLVALKFLARDLEAPEEDLETFLHEARAISRLNHPNIATIYAVEEDEGDRFLAFEYLPGGTLKDKLEQEGRLPFAQIVRWGSHIARALAHAHRHGIVHRDVKTANVLLSDDGLAKLTDFGVAQVSGKRDGSSGETIGTAAYMAPEQVQGGTIDGRSDLFSLGVVLFEMAAGEAPFYNENQAVIFYDVVHTPAPLVSGFRPDAPARFDALVARLLEKSPEDRHQTADEVIAELEELRVGSTSGLRRQNQPESPAATVAVLPFVDMSPERDQEYFCDGMTDEIIAALSGVKGLKVVSRTSSFEFKNRAYDIREIGAQLEVDTVLEGSVRKAGDRIRIAVQLINVVDGFHLWSERYERSLEDVFAIQEEIAEAITRNLRCNLLENDCASAPAARRRSTTNLDAYNSYLAGRYHLNQRGKQAILKALDCFRDAVKTDPEYAQGWSGLADAWVLAAARVVFDADPAEAMASADEAARRAIELDGGSAEAHVSLALVKMRKDWDWPGANEEFERALELKESYAPAHHQYAMCLAFQNRLDEALEHIDRARELDPLSLLILTARGRILHFARRYEEAIEECQRALELNPGFHQAWFDLLVSFGQTERIDEARQALAKLEEGSPDPVLKTVVDGRIAALTGDLDGAREARRQLAELAETRHVSPVTFAILDVSIGDCDRAMDEYFRALEQRDNQLVYLQCEPANDPIRGHPRYPELLAALGLGEPR